MIAMRPVSSRRIIQYLRDRQPDPALHRHAIPHQRHHAAKITHPFDKIVSAVNRVNRPGIAITGMLPQRRCFSDSLFANTMAGLQFQQSGGQPIFGRFVGDRHKILRASFGINLGGLQIAKFRQNKHLRGSFQIVSNN